jgi:hypothetical protein
MTAEKLSEYQNLFKWWSISAGRYFILRNIIGWWVKLGPITLCGFKCFTPDDLRKHFPKEVDIVEFHFMNRMIYEFPPISRYHG